MDTYTIYYAEKVYTRRKDGNCYANYLSLKKVAEGLEKFSTQCWPIIEKMKRELVSKGAFEGPLSRSVNWCIDCLTRPATDADTVRDDMFPDFIGIEIITTIHTLTLKIEEHL